MEQSFWKITDFSNQISKLMQEKFEDEKEGVHYNTVDKWFKAMEHKGIHYVSRVTDEKVYDSLDLEIGCFIYERRKEKWNLDAIYENLYKFFELRPSPVEKSDESQVPLRKEEVEQYIQSKLDEQEQKMEEYKEDLLKAVKDITMKELQSFRNLLPGPKDQEEEKKDYLATSLKVSMELEKEAIQEWEKLPEEERTKKAGWFRREEDFNKREVFIKNYKQQHMQTAIIKAMEDHKENTTIS